MAAGKGKRLALIALAVLVVLIAGGIVAFRVAVGVLKGKVVEALGPESEIKDIRVGWSSVDVGELRIPRPSSLTTLSDSDTRPASHFRDPALRPTCDLAGTPGREARSPP